MEGQGFRDEFQHFEKAGIAIIGVSADPPQRQKKFTEKYGFPFPLLCDEEKTMLKDYGAWGKKKLYGREYEGIHRISYIIDEQGLVEKVYPKVKTKTHAQDILNDLGLM